MLNSSFFNSHLGLHLFLSHSLLQMQCETCFEFSLDLSVYVGIHTSQVRYNLSKRAIEFFREQCPNCLK